jgi:hypothetical protein
VPPGRPIHTLPVSWATTTPPGRGVRALGRRSNDVRGDTVALKANATLAGSASSPLVKARTFRCSAAALVRAVNRRRLCLSDLQICGGFPCPTLVVDPRQGRPSSTSRTPALSGHGLILASNATLRDHRDGHSRSFCTRQRRRGRFPHSNICSQLGSGRRCNWVAMRPTITQPRLVAAVPTLVKQRMEPVSRWLDRRELLAGGDCRLVTWHASVGDRLRKRDCERGGGHGGRKHPI